MKLLIWVLIKIVGKKPVKENFISNLRGNF